jgi:poly-beta-1,6-N-acetyl-D-glucosamine synthase
MEELLKGCATLLKCIQNSLNFIEKVRMNSFAMETYVLISAVKNEEQFIEETCRSVINQKVLPSEWIIVDDNSNDGTLGIIRKYEEQYQFIKVLQNKIRKKRDFASQVFSQMFGYKNISCEGYSYVGFLDGDLRFSPLYYSTLLKIMMEEKSMGIIGGEVVDVFSVRNRNIRRGSENYHVAGGVQLFRKECFEQVAGYMPIAVGGQDTVAEVKAMMLGWKVRAVRDVAVEHLKSAESKSKKKIRANLAYAKQSYYLGYNPIFYALSCLRRIRDSPIMLSFFYKIGFFAIFTIFAYKRPVDRNFIQYIRSIQIKKISSYFY